MPLAVLNFALPGVTATTPLTEYFVLPCRLVLTIDRRLDQTFRRRSVSSPTRRRHRVSARQTRAFAPQFGPSSWRRRSLPAVSTLMSRPAGINRLFVAQEPSGFALTARVPRRCSRGPWPARKQPGASTDATARSAESRCPTLAREAAIPARAFRPRGNNFRSCDK